MNQELWNGLLADISIAFSNERPRSPVDQHWGEYAEAGDFVRTIADEPNCGVVFAHRSLIHFVNNDGFRFLLPLWLKCSFIDGSINDEIADHVARSLIGRLTAKAEPGKTLLDKRQLSVVKAWAKEAKQQMLLEQVDDTELLDQLLSTVDAALSLLT